MDPDVDRMNVYFIQKDEGIPVPNAPPTLYPKLLTEFKKVRDPNVPPVITAGFFDSKKMPIDPMCMIGRRCRVSCDIGLSIPNIYVGGKPSPQMKANDVVVYERTAVKNVVCSLNHKHTVIRCLICLRMMMNRRHIVFNNVRPGRVFPIAGVI